MLINLRGTSGSGKSTAILTVLARFPHKPIYGALGGRLPEAYALTVPGCDRTAYVLGPYLTRDLAERKARDSRVVHYRVELVTSSARRYTRSRPADSRTR